MINTGNKQHITVNEKKHTLPNVESYLSGTHPAFIIGCSMFAALLLFSAFDLLEHSYLQTLPARSLRVLHFLWGFLATSGGMLFVWRVMRAKESELGVLRQAMSSELKRRKSSIDEYMRKYQEERKRADALTETLSQQKQDFLAVLDHRLCNPILANERTISLLQDGAFGATTAKQREILDLLAQNNQEIRRLVIMLSTLYGFQTNKVKLQCDKTDLISLLESIQRKLAETAEKRSIKLSMELPDDLVETQCDVKHVEGLICHLVENGLKHAEKAVTVTLRRKNENQISITVEDDGPGIHTKDISTLFDRFFQISKTGRYPAATGVGLCLCREIAQAHGGTISYENVEHNKGSRFTVELPAG